MRDVMSSSVLPAFARGQPPPQVVSSAQPLPAIVGSPPPARTTVNVERTWPVSDVAWQDMEEGSMDSMFTARSTDPEHQPRAWAPDWQDAATVHQSPGRWSATTIQAGHNSTGRWQACMWQAVSQRRATEATPARPPVQPPAQPPVQPALAHTAARPSGEVEAAASSVRLPPAAAPAVRPARATRVTGTGKTVPVPQPAMSRRQPSRHVPTPSAAQVAAPLAGVGRNPGWDTREATPAGTFPEEVWDRATPPPYVHIVDSAAEAARVMALLRQLVADDMAAAGRVDDVCRQYSRRRIFACDSEVCSASLCPATPGNTTWPCYAW